ncbi:hypothetical protein BC332_03454 [Capsicum chinense]|nr:hypothetical protein BC332_03454 [Capsicum chinense]
MNNEMGRIGDTFKCQDALATFLDAQAFSCIEKELGRPLDTIYPAISASPIAAACLGQVYKAQLNNLVFASTTPTWLENPQVEVGVSVELRGSLEKQAIRVNLIAPYVTGVLVPLVVTILLQNIRGQKNEACLLMLVVNLVMLSVSLGTCRNSMGWNHNPNYYHENLLETQKLLSREMKISADGLSSGVRDYMPILFSF